jgi:predicted metalloprotease with PDZ domain
MKHITEDDIDEINKWFDNSVNSIDSFINTLDTEYYHDYGTIANAVAACAIQAARKMNNQNQGGISGFQAGAVMWIFIRRWMHKEGPLKLLDFDDMLFPQYKDRFDKTISEETYRYLINKAKENLETRTDAAPEVKKHWEHIAKGEIPFGYRMKPDE